MLVPASHFFKLNNFNIHDLTGHEFTLSLDLERDVVNSVEPLKLLVELAVLSYY